MLMRRLLPIVMLLIGCSLSAAQPGRVYTSLQEVEDPEEVYVLRLRHQRLRHVPAAVWQMGNLRELDLRGNRLASLPDSVGTLANLRRLELSRNPIQALPPALAAADSLRELILWDTYITTLPPEFARLDGTLRLIDLRSCPLTPDDQAALSALLPRVEKRWDYACNCGY